MGAWSSPGCLLSFCSSCLFCPALSWPSPAAALVPLPCASCPPGTGPIPGRPFSGLWVPAVCLLAVLAAFSTLNGLPASLWSLLHAPWGRDVYLLILSPDGFLFPFLCQVVPFRSSLGFFLASACLSLRVSSLCCPLCSCSGVLGPSLAGSPRCSSMLSLPSFPSCSPRCWFSGTVPFSF